MRHAERIPEVLHFWFEETEPQQRFIKDPDFDEAIRSRFEPLVKKAMAGQLDAWAESADGLMALIIMLDQFTRNIFRDTPLAFAGDEMALGLSLTGVKRGYLDQIEDQDLRQFLLMPMMHSENLEVQEQSLPLFEKYTSERVYEYAIKHKVIIERFGHFPHRNEILGRPLSAEEIEFLKGPDSSF
ncbi:MAG: DUF924 domain-containing protein [Alphaproteobacteria bacterium]|nr:DUF924 domain-containing protein [Alphaproteobacteria bacterium]